MVKKENIIKLSQLLNEINSFDLTGTKVAIIGGHYILLYDKTTDSLKPVIYEELENEANKKFAKTRVKNFPTLSFELSIKLYNEFRGKEIESKCVLVVNDESLNNENFRGDENSEHFNLVKSKGKRLRREYFSKDDIPYTFKGVLSKYNLDQKKIFETFENVYNAHGNIENSETIFVSEKKLCEKFKNTIVKFKIDDSLFKSTFSKESENGIEELIIKPNTSNSVCLIEDSQCNCGGKTFQFYHDLIKKGFNTIIFFVPNDCIEQVNIGSKLICSSDSFLNKKINIINISNIESDPTVNNVDKDIYISRFVTK